jgi:hypothetical protein
MELQLWKSDNLQFVKGTLQTFSSKQFLRHKMFHGVLFAALSAVEFDPPHPRPHFQYILSCFENYGSMALLN